MVTQYRVFTCQKAPVSGPIIGEEAVLGFLDDRYGRTLDEAWARALTEQMVTGPRSGKATRQLDDLLAERPYLVMKRRVGPWTGAGLNTRGVVDRPSQAIIAAFLTRGTLPSTGAAGFEVEPAETLLRSAELEGVEYAGPPPAALPAKKRRRRLKP